MPSRVCSGRDAFIAPAYSSLFRYWAGRKAFEARNLVLSRVEIPLELHDTIKKQLNAAAVSLPVIPEIRLRWERIRRLLSRPEVPEQLPRDRARDDNEGGKKNEKAEAKCSPSQDVDQVHGSPSPQNRCAMENPFVSVVRVHWTFVRGPSEDSRISQTYKSATGEP